jgi:hypothetical protein
VNKILETSSLAALACMLFTLTGCLGSGGGGSSNSDTNTISATADTTAQSLTVGTKMTSFSPLAPSGGTTPYTYSVRSGTLPAGLVLDAVTGAVTGTPSASQTASNVVFGVLDANFAEASTTSTVSFTVAALTTGYVYEGGLTWMPVSSSIYTYAAAVTLCSGTINSTNDWRLPTQPELSALYAAYPNRSSVLLGLGWTLNGTWSSTPYGSGTHYSVALSYGNVGESSDTGSSFVTCVR